MDWRKKVDHLLKAKQAALEARPEGMKPCANEMATTRLLVQCIQEELQHFHDNFNPSAHHQMYLVNRPYVGCFSYGGSNYLVSARYTPMYIDTKFKDFDHCSYLSPVGANLARNPTSGFKTTFNVFRQPSRYKAVDGDFSFPRCDIRIPDLDLPEDAMETPRNIKADIDTPSVSGDAFPDSETPEDEDSDPAPALQEKRIEIFIPPSVKREAETFNLREQAVLDNVQDPVFRESLNRHVLISGPPGTGKTTVQIKRLSQKNKWDFLRPEEQSCIDRAKWDENRNWIFFTPTQLLKGYLKEAIAAELLPATDDHLKVWSDYKIELLRRVQILQTTSEEKSGGFKRAAVDLNHLKDSKSRVLTAISKEFISYLDGEGLLSVNEDKKAEAFLKGMPRAFDKFRKSERAREYYSDSDDVRKSIEAKRFDSSELSIIIFCLLKAIRGFQAHGRISSSFDKGVLSGLFFNEKYMVCIDEVTDFSAIDIGAMRLVAAPSTDSLTMSGDLMQRLEMKGVESWDELGEVGINHTEFQLERPYRQSGRLTAIARKLKSASLNVDSNESVQVPVQDDDPKVQIAKVTDDLDKVEWASFQILKIVDADHGQLPSIGVIVPSDRDVNPFAEALGKRLYDSSIDVEACPNGRVIGDLNKVRVFCIDHIKGVEFDSVIFCDIDQIGSDRAGLIDKYLYVGLSRCKRHLSISVESFLPRALEPLREMLEFRNQVPSLDQDESLELANPDWRSYPDRVNGSLEMNEEDESLLSKNLGFYCNLYMNQSSVSTEAQQRFVSEVSRYESGGSIPDEKHASAFCKFLSTKIF